MEKEDIYNIIHKKLKQAYIPCIKRYRENASWTIGDFEIFNIKQSYQIDYAMYT